MFTIFFASGSKHHGIYNVFVPVPRHKYRSFHHVARFLYAKRLQNTVFYDVFASRARQEIGKKRFKDASKSTSKSMLNFTNAVDLRISNVYRDVCVSKAESTVERFL